MRYLLLALIPLLPAALLHANEPPTPASELETWNRSEPEWREGPVRYLLTDDEDREYRSLTTPADRASFIARFWASRDLNPFTPGNDAEEIFWDRVSSADELFTLTTIAGWRTDQGRIYILLGPPNEITNYPVPSMDELDPSHFPDPFHRWPAGELAPGIRGAVEWVYRNLKDPRASPWQKVTFVRDESGEYRLSGSLATSFRFEPTWGNLSMHEAMQVFQQTTHGGGRRGNAFTSAGAGDSGMGPTRIVPDAFRTNEMKTMQAVQQGMQSYEAMLSFGQADMFEKAEPPAGATGRVSTAQFFGVVLLQDRVDFFQGTGGTSALITLGVPAADIKTGEGYPASFEVFGRLEQVDDPSHVYQFSTTRPTTETAPQQDVGGHEHRLYEIRGVVPPGEYRVNFGVRIGDRIGAVGDRVKVPDFNGNSLRLAGPVLAEKIGEVSATEGAKGFTLGQLRLLPKLDPTFPVGSEFGFYFQIYHAMSDPPEGRMHLDIGYGISVRQKGIYVPLGKPVTLADSGAAAHAFCFPLEGWSPGEYLLTVTVTDRSSGAIQVGTVPFLVQ
jgi:GWxTD domain-containing protein